MSDIVWQSVACGLIGFILGVIFIAVAIGDGRDDDVKAGMFTWKGVAYKVERIDQ
ncbi:hypothetical protein G6M50_06235 [Agrobacterium rhizogenes]|nr:hypothetical protein [Rhizobium rhizogenes]NTJ77401.1 hypothetical protein [Rhizobium rhizogenes]